MENKGGIRQTELIIYQAADWAGITFKIQKANFIKLFLPRDCHRNIPCLSLRMNNFCLSFLLSITYFILAALSVFQLGT